MNKNVHGSHKNEDSDKNNHEEVLTSKDNAKGENQDNQSAKSEEVSDEQEVSENGEVGAEKSVKDEKSFRNQARKEIEELQKKCSEYQNMCQRVAADFENYKKRTAKERECTYQDALAEAVNAFLPVIDNVERALKASKETTCADESLQSGVELVWKQFNDVFAKLGVVEIRSIGEKFNPEYHNAVMHIDDDSFGENQVIEEFQKGYVLGEKVIRHSMVKVAN